MASDISIFERVVRSAYRHTEASELPGGGEEGHPFEVRNLHVDLPADVRRLFDNGHYSQATFEALKFLDEEVQRIANTSDYGKSLMMTAFNEKNPSIALNALSTVTEQNEQEGFKFLFAGTVVGIRNPRGHKSGVVDDPESCLDYLGLASLLLRRLDSAGVR
ncbi:TIGR02391 family protein [Amycolatopsis sp. Hca4]|uniref:TIGR02391 family protein n=1 Tax=Amycolatopsis sp. Hca4 TaxID=2742131 RepID=UPI0015903656|nr:TIGR02391 family protein [Amycolatopsis sp. Hca4]